MRWFRAAETAEDVVRSLDSELGQKLLDGIRRIENNPNISSYAHAFKASNPDMPADELSKASRRAVWGWPEHGSVSADLRSYADKLFEQAPKLVPKDERETITAMNTFSERLHRDLSRPPNMLELKRLTAQSLDWQGLNNSLARALSEFGDFNLSRKFDQAAFGHATANTAFHMRFFGPPVLAPMESTAKLSQWLDRLRVMQA